jgi:hypothetical protein
LLPGWWEGADAEAAGDERVRMAVSRGSWEILPMWSELSPTTVAAEQLPGGEVAVAQMVVQEPVPPCFSTVAYTVLLTGETSHGVPMATQTPVNPARRARGTR